MSIIPAQLGLLAFSWQEEQPSQVVTCTSTTLNGDFER